VDVSTVANATDRCQTTVLGFFEQFDLCTRTSDTIALPLTARDQFGNEAKCYVEIAVVDTSPDTDGDGVCAWRLPLWANGFLCELSVLPSAPHHGNVTVSSDGSLLARRGLLLA
jgi:hypothetical protein